MEKSSGTVRIDAGTSTRGPRSTVFVAGSKNLGLLEAPPTWRRARRFAVGSDRLGCDERVPAAAGRDSSLAVAHEAGRFGLASSAAITVPADVVPIRLTDQYLQRRVRPPGPVR